MLKRLGCIALLGSLAAAPTFAQASRTWVSGVGDDANPCSRTAPCKTFAGAISKTAAGGEIDALDPGAFGAVTITKAITINGGGFLAGVHAASINGTIVNAGVNDVVVLKGITFDGVGTGLNGIRFLAGKALIVEDCLITGFRTTSGGNGNGIQFAPSGASQLMVVDTVLSDNGGTGSNGGGILVNPTGTGSASVILDNVRISTSLNGIRFDGRNSPGGITAVLRNSSISNNTLNGLNGVSANGLVDVLVENTAISSNATGVRSDGGTVVITLDNVQVFGNTTGLQPVFGGTILSFQNNAVDGNGTNGSPTGVVAPS